MDFTRGKDVKEALELGVKKDAIKIHSIIYTMNGQNHAIKNPKKIEIFIEKFGKGALPKDPIFGIESITFHQIHASINESYDMSRYNQSRFTMGGSDDIPKNYKIEENEIVLTLDMLLGACVNVYDTFLLIPTIEELKKIGFTYLIEYEDAIDIVDKDREKIQEELDELRSKESERDRERMDHEMRVMENERMARVNDRRAMTDAENPVKVKKRRRLFL